jgi:hypothetical protein
MDEADAPSTGKIILPNDPQLAGALGFRSVVEIDIMGMKVQAIAETTRDLAVCLFNLDGTSADFPVRIPRGAFLAVIPPETAAKLAAHIPAVARHKV